MPKRRIRKKPQAMTSLAAIPQQEPDLTDPTQYNDEIDAFHKTRASNLKKRAEADNFKDYLLSASEGETSSGEYHDKEEVLPLDLSSSEHDMEEQIGELREYFSDESEASTDAEMGWGSKKRTFYNTDFVGDEKRGQREETELALEEEREARSLQKRLTASLTESDYLPHDLLSTLSSSRPDSSRGSNRRDDTTESPELNELIQDLQSHLSLLNSLILPSLSIARDVTEPPDNLLLYLNTCSSLSLSYCCSILFYLSLRASGIPVQTHPVCERLVSSRALLSQLSVLDKDMRPALETWLQQKLSETSHDSDIVGEMSNNGDTGIEDIQDILENSLSVPNLVTDLNITNSVSTMDKYSSLTPIQFYDTIMRERGEKKKRKQASKLQNTADTQEDDTEDTGGNKRAINYAMKKNKGLTPRRKKELRNPRVRQRMRYKRALKNRKGQMAGTRPRTSLYAGELTGIRDDISKSRKIK